MTRPFGKEGDLFVFSLFLVLCNRLVTALAALAAIWVVPLPKLPLVMLTKSRDVQSTMLLCFSKPGCMPMQWERGALAPIAPLHTYTAVSLSNVIATTCQYEALKYVSFPLQTLGKCAKMIPVMAWSTLILQKRYKVRRRLASTGVPTRRDLKAY